jgi:hypothetical protein
MLDIERNANIRIHPVADFQFLGLGIFFVVFWQRAPLNSFFLQFPMTIFPWAWGIVPPSLPENPPLHTSYFSLSNGTGPISKVNFNDRPDFLVRILCPEVGIFVTL